MLPASRASAAGLPRRTLQPPTGIPLTARKRATQLAGGGSGVSPSAIRLAIQPNPLARASSAATTGSSWLALTINPPAESQDSGTGGGGGGGGGGGAAVGAGVVATGGAATAAARLRDSGSETNPRITVTTRSAVPSWNSLIGRFSRRWKRERASAASLKDRYFVPVRAFRSSGSIERSISPQ